MKLDHEFLNVILFTFLSFLSYFFTMRNNWDTDFWLSFWCKTLNIIYTPATPQALHHLHLVSCFQEISHHSTHPDHHPEWDQTRYPATGPYLWGHWISLPLTYPICWKRRLVASSLSGPLCPDQPLDLYRLTPGMLVVCICNVLRAQSCKLHKYLHNFVTNSLDNLSYLVTDENMEKINFRVPMQMIACVFLPLFRFCSFKLQNDPSPSVQRTFTSQFRVRISVVHVTIW